MIYQKRKLASVAAKKSGQTMVEYTILVGLIVLALVGVVTALNSAVSAYWAELIGSMTGPYP